MRRALATLVLAGLLLATSAAAEDVDPPVGYFVPASVYTHLLGQDVRAEALTKANATLEQQLAKTQDQRDVYKELADLRGLMAAELRELAEIRQQKYVAANERAERIASEKRKDVTWALVKERCAEGALVGGMGGSLVPGVGNVIGAIGGCAAGAVVGAIEGFVQGP